MKRNIPSEYVVVKILKLFSRYILCENTDKINMTDFTATTISYNETNFLILKK